MNPKKSNPQNHWLLMSVSFGFGKDFPFQSYNNLFYFRVVHHIHLQFTICISFN